MLLWKGWLDQYPAESKLVFYRRHVDDIFVVFKKEEHLKLFLNIFNSYHKNIKFTFDKKAQQQVTCS